MTDSIEGGTPTAAPSRYFLCRLLPPRPTFMLDMSAAEAEIMRHHAAYWKGFLDSGVAIVFGPVADPKGGWGLGIVKVPSEAEAHALCDGDPVILSESGFRYEILAMPRAIVRTA